MKMKLKKITNHIFSFLFCLILFSCNFDIHWFGDLEKDLSSQLETKITFYASEDSDSPCVTYSYIQGKTLNAQDFPNNNEDILNLKPGYKVTGWKFSPSASYSDVSYNYTDTTYTSLKWLKVPDTPIDLYASWVARDDTPYKVRLYYEKDNYDDDEEKYELKETIQCYGTTETSIDPTSFMSNAFFSILNGYEINFTKSATESGSTVIIKGDGSTQYNLYFDKKRTVFYVSSSGLDKNEGSKDAPLATLQKAFSLINDKNLGLTEKYQIILLSNIQNDLKISSLNNPLNLEICSDEDNLYNIQASSNVSITIGGDITHLNCKLNFTLKNVLLPGTTYSGLKYTENQNNQNLTITLSGKTYIASLVPNKDGVITIANDLSQAYKKESNIIFEEQDGYSLCPNISYQPQVYDENHKVINGDLRGKLNCIEILDETISSGGQTSYIQWRLLETGYLQKVPEQEVYSISRLTSPPSSGSTVYVNNVEDLKKLSERVNQNESWTFEGVNVIQTSDIDLLSVSNWTPIGVNQDGYKYFLGNYDGKNYKIKNLNLTTDTDNAPGLFGNVGNDSISTEIIIKNIVLESGNIVVNGDNNYAYVGSLISTASKTVKIENCKSNVGLEVTAVSVSLVGGLVGSFEGKKIINCSYNGQIEIKDATRKIGGIVGDLTPSNYFEMYNCYSGAQISISCSTDNDYDVGGLIGYISSSQSVPKITNSYFTGKIVRTGLNSDSTKAILLGGIVGSASYPFNIENCVSKPIDITGGTSNDLIFAKNSETSGLYSSSIKNCYASSSDICITTNSNITVKDCKAFTVISNSATFNNSETVTIGSSSPTNNVIEALNYWVDDKNATDENKYKKWTISNGNIVFDE